MDTRKNNKVNPPSELIKFIVGSVVLLFLVLIASYVFLVTTNDGADSLGSVLETAFLPSITAIIGLAGGAGIQRTLQEGECEGEDCKAEK